MHFDQCRVRAVAAASFCRLGFVPSQDGVVLQVVRFLSIGCVPSQDGVVPRCSACCCLLCLHCIASIRSFCYVTFSACSHMHMIHRVNSRPYGEGRRLRNITALHHEGFAVPRGADRRSGSSCRSSRKVPAPCVCDRVSVLLAVCVTHFVLCVSTVCDRDLCVSAICAKVIALSRRYVCPQFVIHDVAAGCGDVLFFVERLMCHQHDLAIWRSCFCFKDDIATKADML